MRPVTFFLTFILLTSCNKYDGPISPPSSNLSKIGIEKGQFKKANGDTFFPWGLNYTNAEGVGLIEDDWFNEDVWQIIKSDFIEMKALGANVIRIHLQYHRFMTDENTPDIVAFDRLKELVEFAEEQELYLDVTGLSAYRKSDQPPFYTTTTDEERLNTQKLFWENIAKEIGASSAVFAFNLMNEPVVSVGCDTNPNCDWTPGNGFGGFHFVQNITRTSGNEFTSTFKIWMDELSQTIRSRDNKTLITVGLLALGSFKQFETDLDYISPHIYPISGEILNSINKILDNQSNVPLVIEEISNLSCNILELEEFLNGVDGKYNGLMGHYHGISINELDDTSLIHAIQKNFLKFFINNNPN